MPFAKKKITGPDSDSSEDTEFMQVSAAQRSSKWSTRRGLGRYEPPMEWHFHSLVDLSWSG